jgi:hypothetical protein
MRITGLLQRIGDHAGITVSLFCGIHCVVLAWALTTMPLVWFSQRLWGLPLAWYARLELGLVIGAAVFAVLGLGLGWRGHRHPGPGLLGSAGVLLLSTVWVIEWHATRWVGPGLVMAGGLLLVGAHLWNAAKVAAVRRARREPER